MMRADVVMMAVLQTSEGEMRSGEEKGTQRSFSFGELVLLPARNYLVSFIL
jgi:hypothetical protein